MSSDAAEIVDVVIGWRLWHTLVLLIQHLQCSNLLHLQRADPSHRVVVMNQFLGHRGRGCLYASDSAFALISLSEWSWWERRVQTVQDYCAVTSRSPKNPRLDSETPYPLLVYVQQRHTGSGAYVRVSGGRRSVDRWRLATVEYKMVDVVCAQNFWGRNRTRPNLQTCTVSALKSADMVRAQNFLKHNRRKPILQEIGFALRVVSLKKKCEHRPPNPFSALTP